MKKNTLLPLLLALGLAACSRSDSDKSTASSNNTGTSNSPAAQTASTAKSSPDQSAVAANPPAATTPSDSAGSGAMKPAGDSSSMAANPAAPAASSSPESMTTAKGSSDSPGVAANSESTPNPAAAPGAATSSDIAARISEWKLSADDIKSEMESSGRVVRSKPVGANAPTGDIDNSIVSGLVRSKLQFDPALSDLKLDVEANHGVVTVSGSAHSLDQIGRAMALALDTAGVTQAISTIKIAATP